MVLFKKLNLLKTLMIHLLVYKYINLQFIKILQGYW